MGSEMCIRDRGDHYRIGTGEDIGVIEMPSIPPEALQVILSYRNMIQRGGFSDATFDNIAGQVTALVIAQSAEAAQQIITPYHQAMEYVCTEISRYWVENIIAQPSGYTFLSQLEQDAFQTFLGQEVRYRIISQTCLLYTSPSPRDS